MFVFSVLLLSDCLFSHYPLKELLLKGTNMLATYHALNKTIMYVSACKWGSTTLHMQSNLNSSE